MPEDNAATILYRSGNVAVVQMPQRKFPAIAIQGDSFFILSELARSAMASSQAQESHAELRDSLIELNESLQSIKKLYETTLQEYGIRKPYNG